MRGAHVVCGKPPPHQGSIGSPSATAQEHCHSGGKYGFLAQDPTAQPTRPREQLVPPEGGNVLTHPYFLSHQHPLSSSSLAHCFISGVFRYQPAGCRRAGSVPRTTWGAWHLPAVRPRQSCFLPWDFPTGVWLLQGHVLPPGQHRCLQLRGVWGL